MGYKVLVVDDAGIMLRSVKSMLEDRYSIKLAISGRLAMDMVREEKPDIILLDFDMPGMDGAETFDAIRGLEKGKDVPIVFLTGADDKNTIIKLMKKRPSGYVLKPPSREKLIEVIERTLAGMDDE